MLLFVLWFFPCLIHRFQHSVARDTRLNIVCVLSGSLAQAHSGDFTYTVAFQDLTGVRLCEREIESLSLKQEDVCKCITYICRCLC